jgi:hypothetical protein
MTAMSKVKNMIALQVLIEEKRRRRRTARDIAAANEAEKVLDTIHKELIRLEAIEQAARELLEQYKEEPISYGDGTKAYEPVWDYARDSMIGKLAAALDAKP